MNFCAFALTPCGGTALLPRLPLPTPRRAARSRLLSRKRSTRSRQATMQLPPPSHLEPPLTPEQVGPPGYKWDPDYPGTLKPGSAEDNYPLRKVLESDVYSQMKYEEMDIDERTPRVHPPEEDLLQWLSQQGRLLPRGMSDDEFESEAERQISGITEEDLEFADDDSKMIAYYSRQGEGSAAGASTDFGGFSESSVDAGPGF